MDKYEVWRGGVGWVSLQMITVLYIKGGGVWPNDYSITWGDMAK